MKTWFVTGAAAGIGLEIAREALARGDRVAVTARFPESARELLDRYPDRALPVAFAATDTVAIAAAVAHVADWAGPIDVVVNNEGCAIHGAVAEGSDDEARDLFSLNVTRAVLPLMRARCSGYIINVGSVAGLVADVGSGLYCASKFALEGISEALHAELAPLAIKVTILESRPFRTEFYGCSLQIAKDRIADYDDTAASARPVTAPATVSRRATLQKPRPPFSTSSSIRRRRSVFASARPPCVAPMPSWC